MDLTRILLFVSAWNIHGTKVLIFQNSPYSGRNCLILPYYTDLMKLLLTSFFTTLLLLVSVGSYPQSYPGSKADSANPKLHSPPVKTGAASLTNPSANKAATTNPSPATNNTSTTKPDTARSGTNKAAATNPSPAKAATTTPSPNTDLSIPQPDDEFNIFLLAITIAFFSMVIGGALIGAFAATLLLLSLFALVSAGILSAGLLAALYRRSIAAGFRTMVLIICSLGGILGGTICFWLINRIFNIHLTSPTAALVGAFGGLLCGLLLGFLLAGILRIFINYCRQKLSF
jgi:hypothetical protein